MKGEFIRNESRFRSWVSAGEDAERGDARDFPAEPGRYHLYISYACPWAHRTLIYRVLKGLEDVISVSVVHPLMPPESWVFGEYPGSTPDHVHKFDRLNQLYELAAPDYDGLVSVPVLYDKHHSAQSFSVLCMALCGLYWSWRRWAMSELLYITISSKRTKC